MNFDDLARLDAATFTATFAERQTVIYYPRGDPSRAREISAVIDRTPPDQIARGIPKPFVYKFSIVVQNDRYRGISSTEFDPGADRIAIATLFGGPREKFGFIAAEQASDAGMLKLWIV